MLYFFEYAIGVISVKAPSPHSVWQASNLVSIHERLAPLRSQDTFEKIIQGDLQGIFLRKEADILEMYCYDNDTHKLSNIMSRIDLTNPLRLIANYQQAAFLSSFWQKTPPENIYLAGFGGGCIALLFHHYFQNIIIEGTDIDPNVLAVSNKYFGLGENTLKHIVPADSRKDLQSRDNQYDIIFLDVFAGGGEHVNHMGTVEFFELCERKLKQDGVLMANLVIIDERLHQKIAAMQEVFQHCHIWEFDGAHVVFASHAQQDIDELSKRITGFLDSETLEFNLLEKANAIKPLITKKDAKPLFDQDI